MGTLMTAASLLQHWLIIRGNRMTRPGKSDLRVTLYTMPSSRARTSAPIMDHAMRTGPRGHVHWFEAETRPVSGETQKTTSTSSASPDSPHKETPKLSEGRTTRIN
jgi:hypothetical protein